MAINNSVDNFANADSAAIRANINAVNKSGDTMTGELILDGGLKTDSIGEVTVNNGVQIEGVTLKDNNIDTPGAIGYSFSVYGVNFTTGEAALGATDVAILSMSSAAINTVPYFNGSYQLVSSSVTPTELGYLSGVSSAIQTQLNNKAAASGNITNTTISAFIAYKSANQTGISKGSEQVITFDTEIKDQGSNFASNTFTAPVTGIYLFTYFLTIYDFNSANRWYARLIVNGATVYELFRINPTNVADGALTQCGQNGAMRLSLSANDTVQLVSYVDGGASTYNIAGGGTQGAYLTGKLEC